MPPVSIVRLDPPRITIRAQPGANPLATDLADMFPGVAIRPLYGTAQQLRLEALTLRAQQFSPQFEPGRFRDMYRVVLPVAAAWDATAPASDLAANLRALLLARLPVDNVDIQSVELPLPLEDGVGLLSKDSKHLDPAPLGVDAESVWSLPGGRGSSEVLADVERGWHTGHEELQGLSYVEPANNGQLLNDVPHGTMVLGTVLGRENGKWGLGVAPEVGTAVLASEYRKDSTFDRPAALLDAVDELATHQPVGSVLLLELQADVHGKDPGLTPGLFGPSEIELEVYDLIRLAVANHIIVVEAAGNGTTYDGSIKVGLNLDDNPTLLHGDSGAILVGQAYQEPKADPEEIADEHLAVPFGVTGARIDNFAWGAKVGAVSAQLANPLSTPPTFTDAFEGYFGGTSAASAIVAGTALLTQGLVRADAAGEIDYLNPLTMRSVLRDRTAGVHTPLGDGSTETIGVMPNMQSVATELGLLPDLYVRDNLGDLGGPHLGMLSRSPDIILRSSALSLSDAEAAYGEGSGTEDDEDLSEDLVDGESDAAIYVRVRNRGGKDVVDAQVTVYASKPSALVDPSAWTLIGSTLVDVPQGDTIAVAGPIAWPDPPETGHHCLVATVEHEKDPLLDLASFDTVQAFKTFIRKENNVAWRNFNVISSSGSSFNSMVTWIRGALGGGDSAGEEMELRVEARLPRDAELRLNIPDPLNQRLGRVRPTSVRGKPERLTPAGTTRLGVARLAAREEHAVELSVKLPKHATGSGRRYEVAIVQSHRGQDLGRVTWQLVAEVARDASAGNAPPLASDDEA